MVSPDIIINLILLFVLTPIHSSEMWKKRKKERRIIISPFLSYSVPLFLIPLLC